MADDDQQRLADGRRAFLGATLLGVAGGTVAALESSGVQAADDQPAARLQSLFPTGAPAAAKGYSPGMLAQGKQVVFVSGQGPSDLQADMETQMRQTFDRIGLVLAAAGASFKNVVMLRAYFVHLARDLAVYRKVRTDYLAEPYPASTAVGVTELAVPGLEIEIEAVAVI